MNKYSHAQELNALNYSTILIILLFGHERVIKRCHFMVQWEGAQTESCASFKNYLSCLIHFTLSSLPSSAKLKLLIAHNWISTMHAT